MGCCSSTPEKEVHYGIDANAADGGGGRSITRAYSVATPPAGPPPRSFQGKYLGRVPVSRIQGDDVVRDAHMRLRREYRDKVQTVEVAVSMAGVRSVAGKKNILQDNLIKEISFCSLNSKDPQFLSFITRDRNNIALCHFYRIKAGAQAVHTAIGAAFQAAELIEKQAEGKSDVTTFARRISELPDQPDPAKKPDTRNKVKKGRDLSEVLGTFEVMYFGTVPCTEMRGQHVVLQRLGMLLNSGKMSPKTVALQITGEGIKLIDPIASRPIMISSMIQVCFTTVIQDKSSLKGLRSQNKEWGQSVFAYILKDDRLSRLTCSIFGCRTNNQSNDIAQSVNKAFQVQVEIKKLRQGNPFAAISSKRDTVPVSLFPIQIHRADIMAKKVIGMGQFGEVYLALQVMKNKGEGKAELGNSLPRAVKILRKSAGQADRMEFLREAEAMVKLTHPNLVQIVGVAVQQRPWLTVLEYIKYGDLLAVVKAAAEKDFDISYTEQLVWGEQMAAGMKYIASKHMIHMDLAARNVLLGERNRVKIADFGLTRDLPPEKNYYRLMQTLKLPIKWMAIESMKDKIFTVKTDVWGFGIMVWEILSYGEIPYGDVKNIEVEKLVTGGMRLQCVPGCPEEYHAVLSKCWIRNPETRPDFDAIYTDIVALQETAKGNYPPPRPDVGAALHDEGPQQVTGEDAAAGEQELTIQDNGADQWKLQNEAMATRDAAAAADVAAKAKAAAPTPVVPDDDDGEEDTDDGSDDGLEDSSDDELDI